MKKYLLIPAIFLVSLFLTSTAFAFGFDLTNFDTKVQAYRPNSNVGFNGYAIGDWYEVIGDNNIFGTGGMSLTGDASSFTFEIKTNFSGYANIGSRNHYIGDLFLFADGGTWGGYGSFRTPMDAQPCPSNIRFLIFDQLQSGVFSRVSC
jgi:hypothetical protein